MRQDNSRATRDLIGAKLGQSSNRTRAILEMLVNQVDQLDARSKTREKLEYQIINSKIRTSIQHFSTLGLLLINMRHSQTT